MNFMIIGLGDKYKYMGENKMNTSFEFFKVLFKSYIWFIVIIFTLDDIFPEPLSGNWSYVAIIIVAIISFLMAIF